MFAFGVGGIYAYLKTNNLLAIYSKVNPYILSASLFLYFLWTFNKSTSENCGQWFLIINSIISLWFIHLVINNNNKRVKKYFLENKTLNLIGKVSYGIYLFHYVMHFIYEKIITLCFRNNIDLQNNLLEWKNCLFYKDWISFYNCLSEL